MKNPLTIAFGNTLKEIRNEQHISIDDLVDKIGINVSYYRLIESGTNAIHISKVIDIVNAFNYFGARLDYEGVSKILMGIYFTNPIIKLIEDEKKDAIEISKNKLFENIKVYDPKLDILVKAFDKLKLFSTLEENSKVTLKILEDNKIKNLVTMFMCDYRDFGESYLSIQNEYLSAFFDKIPSLYIKLFYDLKQNIKSLPSNIGISNLWEWENYNKADFIELNAYTENPSHITSLQNLQRYTYSYLWNESFKKASIFYTDNLNAEELKDEFEENISKVIEGNKILEDKFQEALSKITFYKINSFELPEGNPFLKNSRAPYKPNTTWIFSMKNKINVAFLGQIGTEDLLSTGETLNTVETINLYNKFEAIRNGI